MAEGLKIGLVLSGGGSRGAYQVGVLKAIWDLGLYPQFTIAAGTSTGAINGAGFVQGQIDVVEEIWSNLNFEKIFSSIKSKRYLFLSLGYEILRKGGADVEPLKELIRKHINYKRIYANEIDFGLVTYNFSEMKPKYLFKKDIDKEDLIEYIIASSTFPIFQRHIIKDQAFLDGGLADNVPLKMAIEHESKPDLIICVNVAHYDSPSPIRFLQSSSLTNLVKKLRRFIPST